MKKIISVIAIYFICSNVFASLDSILNIYTTDSRVAHFLISNIDSISFNDNEGIMNIHMTDGLVESYVFSEIDSMNYTEEEFSLPEVGIESVSFDYATNSGLCVVNVTESGGAEIIERGICWSVNQNPTVSDNKRSTGTSGGRFYEDFSGLQTGDTYYVRAYASNGIGITYSDQKIIETMSGKVTYTIGFSREQYPQYYDLLTVALDSACYYYNLYTDFRANIYIYYSSGIPTAQANYHGSIGFGSNTSYMWVGTVMHEMAHYFGSGTTSIWKSLMAGGIWQGEVAQALCQELSGKTLKGDNNSNPIHFWPYGINYRSEVGSSRDLINHAKIVQAMLIEDCGLPSSW